MPRTLFDHVESDGRALTLACIDRATDRARIPAAVHGMWATLAPWARFDDHFAYVRDAPDLSIDGVWPGGSCYDPRELFVALPSWGVDESEIVATLAHESHHMVRWGHQGTARTLGETLVSEGFACRFEERFRGRAPAWASQMLSTAAVEHVLAADWSAPDWDYRGLFFEGPHGRWIGYTLAYRLATLSDIQLGPSLTEHLVAELHTIARDHGERLAGSHDEWCSSMMG